MNNTQIITAIIRAVPGLAPLVNAQMLAALKASGDYTSIRAEMSGEIHDAVYDYLTGSGNVTAYRSAMALAVSQAYIAAADAGYQDAGADLPLDPETATWARGQLDAQLGFIDQLFESLRELRKEGDVNVAAEALARANGYGGGLDGFYNEAVLRGSKNIVLEFGGSDGKENCPTCKSLKGKRHRVSWWIDNGLVPGQAGNENYECKGYNCAHILFNPKTGEEFTV
jgi:hypothetical protein